ncbi:MAG: PorP/SprF family type IX secretion system membrane protein [Bacteroidales bacterium]|nr:PorP/SprF family type IX secretion system membrane protein [Bacteroidales bacterium]
MKHIILITALTLATITIAGQQIPLSENYFSDRYSLAPSYAGNHNVKYLFTGYRSDWSGVPGGPKTVRISYNDALMQNAGVGGKVIYDKSGIFRQLYIMGSYSYRLEFMESHFLMFGLSAGIYNNGINMSDYYNDPDYTIDPALIDGDIKSSIKFMSDFSVVYRWENVEAGLLFTNITFGDANYAEVETVYKPLANFQFHTSYNYALNEEWDLMPLVIVRGGKYVRSQFEMAVQAVYADRFRGSVVYRDPSILGVGLGADIINGLKFGYNFNMATNVTMNAFSSHEVTLGINIFEFLQ